MLRAFPPPPRPRRRGVTGDDAAQWTLTFTSQIGAMELLGVEDHLTGMGATHRDRRLPRPHSLGGTFALKFRGTATRPLAHDATSLAVARALVEVPAARRRERRRRAERRDRVGGASTTGSARTARGPARARLEWTLTLVARRRHRLVARSVGYDWKTPRPRRPLDGDVYDETPTAAPTYDTLAPSYDASVPSLKPRASGSARGPCPNLTAAGALTGAGASVVARSGIWSAWAILAATNRTAFGCERRSRSRSAAAARRTARAAARRRPATATRRAYALGAAARDGAAFFPGRKEFHTELVREPGRRRRRAARAGGAGGIQR